MFDAQTPAPPTSPVAPTSVSTPLVQTPTAPREPTQAGPPPVSVASARARGATAGSESTGRVTAMPETFYMPPKRPTVASRVVVVLSVAVLIGAVMWGAGVFLSDRIDISLPFFLPKRKNPGRVQPPTPTALEQLPVSVPTPPVNGVQPSSAPTPTLPEAPSDAAPASSTPSSSSSGTAQAPPQNTASTPTQAPAEQTNPAASNQSAPAPVVVERVHASTDTDSDSLTDEEEKLFQTSPVNPDSDGDGFKDGDEVKSLYNPNKGNGAKLLDSGLVTQYTNPVVHYTVLYPKPWIVKATDNTAQEVVFAADTGEFVSVLVQSNEKQLSIRDWYAGQNPSVEASTLAEVKTSSGLLGIESSDGLTTYIAAGRSVIVLAYNIGLRTDASFLTTVAMMRNSLTVPAR